jgi:ATP-dependent RNA helicase SUPV3L1/SUV3
MAFIRTWTYITHHARWLDDAKAWQEQARALEDDLSDALHAKLVARFVDAGHRRGRIRVPVQGAFAEQLRHAVDQLPAGESENLSDPSQWEKWIDALVEAGDDRFGLGDDGQLLGDGRVVGRMSQGADRLRPEVVVLLDDLGPGAKLRLQRRLVAWTRDLAETLLAPLRDERLAKLGPAARGILYQLEQGLGTALASRAQDQLRQIHPSDRSWLGRAGIKLGRKVVYATALLRPEALLARATLCRAFLRPGTQFDIPAAHTRYFLPSDEIDDDTCLAMGFPVVAGVAIRADEIESIAAHIAGGVRASAITRRLGCDPDMATAIFESLVDPRRHRR